MTPLCPILAVQSTEKMGLAWTLASGLRKQNILLFPLFSEDSKTKWDVVLQLFAWESVDPKESF